MASITLMVLHDSLAIPGELVKDELTRKYILRDEAGIMVIRRYDAGDADTFGWPLSAYWLEKDWKAELARALFDDRECGHFPSDVDEAVLPDGQVVSF